MDGIHDLGGRQGFGAIPRDRDAEATFSDDWERRVFGMSALGRRANTDAFRHAIERIPPVTYLTAGYWGRWLAALERLEAERDPRVAATTRDAKRELTRPPRFVIGVRVRARDLHRNGHTRLPGYVRGRRGTIVMQHGGWVYPDTHAHGEGEQPQHVYAVRFEGSELWGDTAEPGTSVTLDLFEPYLEEDSA